MITWALVLHFYQPPTQSATITEAVLRQCYLPLCDLLLAFPEAHITVNISGSLLESIRSIPDSAFFEKLKILVGRGQVEIINSAMYHPLLPLITPEEIERHLKLNQEAIQNFLQINPSRIIYPPELAISPGVVREFKNSGDVEAVILDESSISGDFSPEKLPEKAFYRTEELKLIINARAISEVLRSYPKELTGEKFLSWLTPLAKGKTVVSACDAEVFGHHYTERINLLRDLFQGSNLSFRTLSEVLPETISDYISPTDIHPSTWQTSPSDLLDHNPYPYWLAPGNDLQNKYHELAVKAYGLLSTAHESWTKPSAEKHYHRGISSCHYYWLSNRPWWHPDMVEAGARELIKCIRSLDIDPKEKAETEHFYHDFLMKMWQHHWSGKVEKKYKEYDKERETFLTKLPIR